MGVLYEVALLSSSVFHLLSTPSGFLVFFIVYHPAELSLSDIL